MTCLGTVQSAVQNGTVANGNANTPAVTATVMMAPPNYDVATSRIPRYSSVSTPPGNAPFPQSDSDIGIANVAITIARTVSTEL